MPGSFKANPTLAAGDVKVYQDNVLLGNIATLPVVAPASSVLVKFVLSASEMNADVVDVVWGDQTVPKEWSDGHRCILTTA